MLVFRPCHAYQRLPAACRLLSTYRSAPSPAAKLRGSTAAPPPTRGRQRQLRAMAASATAAPTDWAADGDYPATLLQALAVPPGPGFRPLGARVEHLLAPRQGRVAQLVGEALSLPEVRCTWWAAWSSGGAACGCGCGCACVLPVLCSVLWRRARPPAPARRQHQPSSPALQHPAGWASTSTGGRSRAHQPHPSSSPTPTHLLHTSQGAAELLLRFGAIHACPVPPPTPATVLEGLPPEEAQRLLDRRAEALRRAGNSVSLARLPSFAGDGALFPAGARACCLCVPPPRPRPCC